MQNTLLVITIVVIAAVVGCDSQNTTDNPVSTQKYDGDFPIQYEKFLSKLGSETLRELADASASTAGYHDINTALDDGYIDINVVVQNMGYHYLKSENIDGTFYPGKPAILDIRKIL